MADGFNQRQLDAERIRRNFDIALGDEAGIAYRTRLDTQLDEQGRAIHSRPYEYSAEELQAAMDISNTANPIRFGLFDAVLNATENPRMATSLTQGAEYTPGLGTAMSLKDAEIAARDIPDSYREGDYADLAGNVGQAGLGLLEAAATVAPFGKQLVRGGRQLARNLNQPGPVPTMYSNPVMQPFDMRRGIGDNGGPRIDTRVPYNRSGEEILERISDIPTAKIVMGFDELPPAGGFTGVKSLQPRVLSEHQSAGYLSDEIVAPQSQPSIAPLLGRDVMAIVGDPTGRHTVTSVSGRDLPEEVASKAGFQYIDVPGQGYAGAQSATSSKANEAAQSQDPYYMTLMMGEKSGDFSMHQGNIFGQMFKNATIASADVPKVDEAIRKIGVPKLVKVLDDSGKPVLKADGTAKTKSVTTYPFKDFPSVADPNAVDDYIKAMPTGTLRAYFLKGMDKSGLQKMGVPRVSDARLAAADAEQIGMDWGTVGYRGFTPDLERGLYPTTSVESTTYDTGIGKVGQADTFLEGSRGIPANLMYRDLSEAQRAKGTGGGLLMNSPDYKVFEGSPKRAKQRIDDMAVETIDTFLEIERRQGRQAALQYAGSLLSGGRITSDLIKAARKANAPTWMLAAMAPAAGLLAPSTPQDEQQQREDEIRQYLGGLL